MTDSSSSYEADLIIELERIAEAVSFPSDNSFVFGNLPEVKVEPKLSGQPGPELIERLVDALYWNAYVRKFDPSSLRPADFVELADDPEFTAAISAIEPDSRWDYGWRVESVMADGSVLARKNDCYRSPVPGEFLFDVRPGTRPGPGDMIGIRILGGSTRLQPGFYFAFSDVIPDQYDEFQSVRFYFNSKSGGLQLLTEIRKRFNRFQIPFRFKCPVSLDQFDRLDSGVLYVPWRYRDITLRCIAAMRDTVSHELSEGVPLFTKRIDRGIGMAEDPGTMQSFGRVRCELVARGLWSATFDGPTTKPVDRIREQFESAGLQFSRPWLNPGSIDSETSLGFSFAPPPSWVSNTEMPSALWAADRIGSKICRDAVWSGSACNWLDWSAEERNGNWVAIYRALGPTSTNPCSGISLYEGTSGIALFLARLFVESGDSTHRATLLGSVSQIVKQLDELESSPNVAFYSGWPGASWAVTEIGRALEDEQLIQSELNRLKETATFEPQLPQTDILLGSAGLITGLLDLYLKYNRQFGCTTLLDIAVTHGDFLLSVACRSDAGWSWETLPVPVHQNLTGYAHGASGIVVALAELARATGEDRFRQAVQEGLRYEQSQFSQQDGNWRDYRADAAEVDAEAFQFGWCHGAPGIGLARYRLMELGFDTEDIRRDLEVAIATTEKKLHYANSPGQRDFCICHGLAGNAELPLLVSRFPGHSLLREHAERVGRFGIDQFEKTGIPWPYNLGGTGETPTLFCGMAGIGYFYLRLWRPDKVPSILLLQPPHHGSDSAVVG